MTGKKSLTTKTTTTKKMTIDNNDRSYYCSMKFRFLKIDLNHSTTYNCHAAAPHGVDFDWLSNNPGQLFNTPVNIVERNMMLANQRNSSCEQNCWRAEDKFAISPRIEQGGEPKTHIDSITLPEIIDLTVSSDCNLTCSYCCKEFSSAWRRDLLSNGDYHIESESNRFKANNSDKILEKFSQTNYKTTKRYQSLMDEVKLAVPTLKKLVITGGEPFLDNQLIDTIAGLALSDKTEIEMFTGLGVSIARFEKILSKLQPIKNLYLNISAECTGKLYEFNRYGNSWADVELKLQLIRKYNIRYEFHSTLSNLTVFGFADFANRFKDDKISVTFAFQPDIMAPYVLDPTSKKIILEKLQSLPEELKNPIVQSLSAEPSESQRNGINQFLTEFVRRRQNLDISIYPLHFLNWINYVV